MASCNNGIIAVDAELPRRRHLDRRHARAVVQGDRRDALQAVACNDGRPDGPTPHPGAPTRGCHGHVVPSRCEARRVAVDDGRPPHRNPDWRRQHEQDAHYSTRSALGVVVRLSAPSSRRTMTSSMRMPNRPAR